MAKFSVDDTICAIATAPGEGAVGILRLSGPESFAIGSRIFRSSSGCSWSSLRSRMLHHGRIIDARGKTVDEIMLAFFESPRSYTREDMVEIMAHGGPRVLREILQVLVQEGARIAEPGEFTKRAFLNGRIDLSQAEAVIDLIRAKTERAKEQALEQLQGGFSRAVGAIKDKLLRITAHVEAYVDFPEEDIEVHSMGGLAEELASISAEIEKLLATFHEGALVREGVLAVIVGRPNVGKSSLLNSLLDRERAIVSEFPGTTRDAVEEALEIDGILIRVADTAGLRSAAGWIEGMGIRKTREYLTEAGLVLFVIDGSQAFSEEDREIYEEVQQKKHIVVVNKQDLPQSSGEAFRRLDFAALCPVSAKTGQGIAELRQAIARSLLNGGIAGESAVVTRMRHKQALEETLAAVGRAGGALEKRLSVEFMAFDLRQALDRLGEIVGEIYTEDILDRIFREFCIGK
jgi:tRNA modification GTPase